MLSVHTFSSRMVVGVGWDGVGGRNGSASTQDLRLRSDRVQGNRQQRLPGRSSGREAQKSKETGQGASSAAAAWSEKAPSNTLHSAGGRKIP